MNGGRGRWMRVAIAAIALSWALLTIATVTVQCMLPQPSRHAAHPNHPLAAAVGAEFLVNPDHAHLCDDASASCLPDLAAVPLTRSQTAAFAADPVSTAATGSDGHTMQVVVTSRGPPGVLESPQSRQGLLTWYCLSRR